MMEDMEDKLRPGGNWKYQMWLAPYGHGDGSMVYIVEDEKIIRRCVGNFRGKENVQHLVRGFYEAQQELIDVEEERKTQTVGEISLYEKTKNRYETAIEEDRKAHPSKKMDEKRKV